MGGAVAGAVAVVVNNQGAFSGQPMDVIGLLGALLVVFGTGILWVLAFRGISKAVGSMSTEIRFLCLTLLIAGAFCFAVGMTFAGIVAFLGIAATMVRSVIRARQRTNQI
jgi:hypothetical protein